MVQKSAARRPTAPTSARRPQGIIRAIVAVTGVEDEVGDIITPGIFARTLARRRPKVVFHHDFKDFAGRILHIEEWLPGDRRLPAKQPNGQPWPRDAGVLVATMQFNMATARGREVYEWARFYAESGEAAWSIGYQVPPGMAAKRGSTRVIYGIDLFEVSLVLHGAHPMTMALEVKSSAALVEQARAMETKATPAAALPDSDEYPDVMIALYPSPDVAGQVAVAGGEPVEELHVTLALLDDPEKVGYTVDDVVAAVTKAVEGGGPLTGQVGGLGLFPDGGHGAPVWAPVDVPGLERVRERIVSALDDGPAAGAVNREHGYTPHMTLGYGLPTVEPVPVTPVAFDHVYVVHKGERTAVPLQVVNGRVIETKAEPAPIESKAAAGLLSTARTTPTLTSNVETKMAKMTGSFEARRDLIQDALTKQFGAGKGGTPWVDIVATFDDHVIAAVAPSAGPGEPEHFHVDFTVDGDKVHLGKRTPIDLELVALPGHEDRTIPLDMPAALVVAPAIDTLESLTSQLERAPLEFKAFAAMREPMAALLDTLAVKGMDVEDLMYGEVGAETASDDDEEDEVESGQPFEAKGAHAYMPNDEPTHTPEPPAPEDVLDDEDEETVTLDPEEVQRELASLRS